MLGLGYGHHPDVCVIEHGCSGVQGLGPGINEANGQRLRLGRPTVYGVVLGPCVSAFARMILMPAVPFRQANTQSLVQLFVASAGGEGRGRGGGRGRLTDEFREIKTPGLQLLTSSLEAC